MYSQRKYEDFYSDLQKLVVPNTSKFVNPDERVTKNVNFYPIFVSSLQVV